MIYSFSMCAHRLYSQAADTLMTGGFRAELRDYAAAAFRSHRRCPEGASVSQIHFPVRKMFMSSRLICSNCYDSKFILVQASRTKVLQTPSD